MRRIFLFCSLIIAHCSLLIAQHEWVLQSWTSVSGSVDKQYLGNYVYGIPSNANLPFKAAVSKVGSTGLYTLQTKTDVSVKKIFLGENILSGDLNYDGYTDVVVTKLDAFYNHYDTVLVYWGTSSGLDTLNPLKIPADGGVSSDIYPACIGDVNNDDKPDLILSEQIYGFVRGKVSIFLNPVTSAQSTAIVVGDTAYSGLGITVCVADLNGDSLNDLIVKGWNQLGPQVSRFQYVNIYYGNGKNSINTKLSRQLKGAFVGRPGLACFDVNGDGIADLLWTCRELNTKADYIYVHYGGPQFDTIPNLKLKDPGGATFGNTIVNAGDMNGDGYDDIAVGSEYSTVSGYVWIFSGGPKIDGYFDAGVGQSFDGLFGHSIACIGDVNGDGLSDIIVGAPQYFFEQNSGYWEIFLGSKNIPVTKVREEKVSQIPQPIVLSQNYPNPFNPSTVIAYSVPKRSLITLKIFNSIGQEVQELYSGERETGLYRITFKAGKLSSGEYYYRVTGTPLDGSPSTTQTKTMTLLK